MANVHIKSIKVGKKSEWVGVCLNCAANLSFCGKPFTADLECPKCGAVNAYDASFQPVRLKERVENREVKIAA